jgi:hypothetical protein
MSTVAVIPVLGELMKNLTSPARNFVALNGKSFDLRLVGDGEVPFIC